ncbi:MAG TPA: DNA replication/repair protein RecF [Frankiaceae bacterium]|nr:DNA replication/repair protein RecF [Frankiaceae bacterium]
MYVARLHLTDFRSYEDVSIPLEPGVTTFLGANGQGKTNLLEALNYVATLASHRVASDAPLIRMGAERAVVRAGIVRDERKLLVELELVPGRANRAKINRSPVRRAREVLGALRTVLFAPEDLALVRGDPGERRRFLDELVVARAPRFAGVRADYERVLKQRTMLLRSASGRRSRTVVSDETVSTLDVWDSHLASYGAELLAARLRLVDALAPLLDKAYSEVSGGRGPVSVVYQSSVAKDGQPLSAAATEVELQALLADELQRLRPQELERGVTLAGPHRDDIVVSIGELPAKGYASQGESWSLALALRLASYELLRSDGAEPVLLLDDVFAELDDSRRERLALLVRPAEQVLITAAVADDVPALLAGARFEVYMGSVSAA